MATSNHLGQPVGAEVPGWQPPPVPEPQTLVGRYGRLEQLAVDHAAGLFAANSHDSDGRNFTYLPYGPFDAEGQRQWVAEVAGKADPMFFTVFNADGQPVGVLSYLRINPAAGSIEVGHINFSPLLQRTPLGTEAIYLLMRQAFDLGYRRFEWKCDALNAPSRAAALRYGLSYEGVFRQAAVVKGRNRDTAWYAATNEDWSALRAAFEKWLAPGNFDGEGQQRMALRELTAPVLVAEG